MNGLTGKTVVVIGGASGMGRGIAEASLGAGAIVIVGGESKEKLAEFEKEVPVRGEEIDIRSEDSVREFFARVGRLDHLAVTASPGERGGFLEQSVQDAHGYMEGKFWSSYRAAWYAAPRMNENGSLLFLSGGLALRPKKGSLVVTAAFGAVESLTRALAVELAPLRVNAIRPGTIDTPLWSSLPEEERAKLFEEAARNAPAGRVGTIADIGSAALYLMTNEFVTGAVLDVDGGALLAGVSSRR